MKWSSLSFASVILLCASWAGPALGRSETTGIADLNAAPSPVVVINEIMASNSTTVKDPQGHYEDWVELYNAGTDPIDVGGWYLTDDPAEPAMWQIPRGHSAQTTIPAGGYLLIWLDGDTGATGLHASFRLGAAGDRIALFDVDGMTLVDSIEFAEQTLDVSYGRDPLQPEEWRYFGQPTPGTQNAEAYPGQVAHLQFSHDRGFCAEPFSVTITTNTPGATILYTLDGSSPFDNVRGLPIGSPYTGPIPVTTTTSLRAIAIKPGWMPTAVATHTYIFLDHVICQPVFPPGWPTNWGHTGAGDYEMDPEVVYDPCYKDTIKDDLQSVPTLSLVTDRNYWFGSGGQGIYLQGELVERPVSAEMILPDGQEGFQIDCAVMIVGGSGTSRWKMDKLSLRLKFRSLYGPSKLRFPVFGPGATDEFDTLVVLPLEFEDSFLFFQFVGGVGAGEDVGFSVFDFGDFDDEAVEEEAVVADDECGVG